MALLQEPGVIFMNVGRDEAEAQLANAAPGSYIVRPSSRPGNLSLTYRARSGRLGHLLLVKEKFGWTTDGVNSFFPTVRLLLAGLPYKLRLSDEQMHAATTLQRRNPPQPAASGYGAVPTPQQMQASAGYGKTPSAPSGYGQIPQPENPYAQPPAARPAPQYGRLLPNNTSSVPGYTTQNMKSGNSEYGRVPSNVTNGSAEYGRVPVGQSSSPYGALKPTSSSNSTGYGRVPQPNDMSAQSTPGYVQQRAPSTPHARLLPNSGGRGQGSPMASRRSAQRRHPNQRTANQEYGRVSTAQSATVNAPHQLAMQSLKLMQGNAPLAGHERFLRGQLALLAKAKDKAVTSTPVFTALVALGAELAAYHAELRTIIQQPQQSISEAILRNSAFQQHYISLQMQVRNLKTLLEDTGGGFSRAIHSELGSKFWAQHIGKNNAIQWKAFFQVLQSTLGMNLSKVESFVKFMFDCNKENKITTQSFNMFVHWFDYEGMSFPTTVKDFLLTLVARAEEVFFFEGFHGFCSREKAERILIGQPPKSYLIRLSDSSAGVFILSYVDSKRQTRHRLLNQVDKQGFMVEKKTYNTLPDLLNAHGSVLSIPVPNSITFDAPTHSIYGGGAALHEALNSASIPLVKAAEVMYHANIVLNRIWLQVRLELRETEMLIQTVKSPLRRTVALSDVAECIACNVGQHRAFRIVSEGQSYVFSCDDPTEWVTAIQKAVAECHRTGRTQSSTSRSAEEKLVHGVVARRCDSSEALNELKAAVFAATRKPGMLSVYDSLFLSALNETLAKLHNRKRGGAKSQPANVNFSKLDLDMGLDGNKCETEVPVRDSLVVTNSGGTPIAVRFDNIQRSDVTLKFVPEQISVPPNGKVEVHVTLFFKETASLRELVHVAFGPGHGVASIFLSLSVSSKIMEALAFEDIDFGPRLGSGAFGQVFHGSYKGHEVAVKAVGFEPDFDQELAILRELRAHPNIVEYIGACKRQPFQGFIVLEFMSLGSLDRYIHDQAFALELPLAMRVSLDVANGLAHLHKSKIMHLDLKPANVLVSSLTINAPALVKLADFGLSQSRDSAESFRGDYVEGTLLYMAPEMLRDKLFSFKGDIFSFGMTVWEMLTRQQPYTGGKHKHLNKKKFEEIRERGELPGDLNQIDPMPVRELLTEMMSYDHEARPSGEECARKIDHIRSTMVSTQPLY